MPTGSTVGTIFPMIVGSIITIEMFFYLKVGRYLLDLKGTAMKAMTVLSAAKISDHWKEKTLPCYAVKILSSSLKISFCLGALLATFTGVYGLMGVVLFHDINEGFQDLIVMKTQFFLITVSIIYGGIRSRLRHG